MPDKKDVKKEEKAQAAKAKKASKRETKEPKETKTETSGQFKDLIKQIESMSVQDLNTFVSDLEAVFGPVVAASAPASGAEAGEEATEAKSEYNIELTSAGSSVISVIKAVKDIAEIGLVDAKKLVDSAPTVIKEGVKAEEAEEMKSKLEEAGATVELK